MAASTGKGNPTLKAATKKNPEAVASTRLGWTKVGSARAQKVSGQERAEIARAAARKRWANREGRKDPLGFVSALRG